MEGREEGEGRGQAVGVLCLKAFKFYSYLLVLIGNERLVEPILFTNC